MIYPSIAFLKGNVIFISEKSGNLEKRCLWQPLLTYRGKDKRASFLI